jgi:predicted AlkP superfamily phosphohydrolase/phosphomutase
LNDCWIRGANPKSLKSEHENNRQHKAWSHVPVRCSEQAQNHNDGKKSSRIHYFFISRNRGNMRGAFCVNEWLIQEGYLVLKEKPQGVTDLDKVAAELSRTKAWA